MGAHTLHIANGSATTRLFERAGILGDCSIWADPLHDGPVPEGLSAEQLREVRARYFAPLIGDDDWRGFYEEVTRWDEAARNMARYEEVVLWFEHDLFDQLNLIQLLDRLDGLRHQTSTRISLVCIDQFPGHPSFKGLGELTPEEIATLTGQRTPVSEAQFDLARRAWRAFTSPDPRRIEELLSAGTSALPFLAKALHRQLEEFPDSVDGLSRTERRTLEIGLTPTLLQHAFLRSHDGEDAFYIADLSFFALVRSLAATEPQMLKLSDLPADVLDLRRLMASARIQTTNVGREVVERRADRVKVAGIDTWHGGVHLVGRESIWRWDRAAGRLIRPA